MSLLDDVKILTTPNASKAGTLYSIKPDTGLADLDITRATTATRVNSSGIIETVAANVPQLDYTDATCPSFMVEPQRTNVYIYSNDYTTNQTGTNVVVTANAATSPDGTNNATKFEVSSGGYRLTWGTFFTVSAGEYTCSFYAKNINATEMKVGIVNGNTFGNIVTPFSYISQVNTTSWTRVSFNFTVPSGTTLLGVELIGTGSLGDFLFFGHQVEKSASNLPRETSYIPTTSASVTRNLTTFTKAGLSSLMGSSEGVLFLEISADNVAADSVISIGDTSTNWVAIGSASDGLSLWLSIMIGGSWLIISSYWSNPQTKPAGFFKIAAKYKSGDSAIWINGTEAITSTTTATPTGTFSNIWGYYAASPTSWNFNGKIRQLQVYDTILTDDQLLALTT
jgi:hypothetical protein